MPGRFPRAVTPLPPASFDAAASPRSEPPPETRSRDHSRPGECDESRALAIVLAPVGAYLAAGSRPPIKSRSRPNVRASSVRDAGYSARHASRHACADRRVAPRSRGGGRRRVPRSDARPGHRAEAHGRGGATTRGARAAASPARSRGSIRGRNPPCRRGAVASATALGRRASSRASLRPSQSRGVGIVVSDDRVRIRLRIA